MGSATNAVALQVGGALGVAVIGSVASTRYQDDMRQCAGRAAPADHGDASHFGFTRRRPDVAHAVGGATGALLAGAARAAFMSGLGVSFSVGAIVALGGIVIVLAYLPSGAPAASVNADTRGSDEEASLSELQRFPPSRAIRLL